MASQTYDCLTPAGRTDGIKAAVDAIRAGQCVVMPTDTVYGIGCDAFNNDAVAKLLATKRRGPDMPVPVLVGSWSTIQGLVREFTDTAQTLVEAFWPGGLSIVVPEAPSLPWNLGDTRGTVLLRMPNQPLAIELLREVGPMGVSSANLTGNVPPVTTSAARQQFGNAVPVYLDGGRATVGEPSTIIDISGPSPVILRNGAISAERIGEVLNLDPESLRRT
ncbi:L-threonylcarbamoyladenylate synthase [Corynebacterium sanguinis]|uniref:L-threonylcarbamoyladenylate synthase n=1 Tax=Corynebacterium sanguinis TaxID=2594913 RepID=A0A6C1TUU6_9CORY|nr:MULTISPECIES: L-threonylcarbamoyladenylate synthase [Corynebacterium]MBA4504802.1 threonylcarbamoyl-AMP synthase [Corynebacterium sanguinis]MCT1412203.1 L-threonylcarbamoyladenylate synthase [Corynebacterium sanguinis]MCT1414210.1 L-threonylcarbamoyladenylate synthase [Corynebacterium sanguinis]MCT1425668.1 L-threonylcarbamoyladenylate synthase [Corynebacterium sanguinis]MCT1445464.1 L-threonylcarbamoyladenylate synthase [Corynebacterium sanguinis]